MSQQNLKDFVYAAERSPSLRRELHRCKDSRSIIKVASSYGFTITSNDLSGNENAEKIENWFKTSKIPPFKIN